MKYIMKYIILLFLFLYTTLDADIIDDYYILQAQKNHNTNELVKAMEYYKKIKSKTPQIYYNMGNISYEQKDYINAIDYYQRIKLEQTNLKELNYKKFHNIANSYMQTNDIKKAKEYYQKALKINQHADTIKNLNLANKLIQLSLEKEKEKKDAAKNIAGISLEGFLEFNDNELMSKEGNEDNNKLIIFNENTPKNNTVNASENIKETIELKAFEDEDNTNKLQKIIKQSDTNYFSQIEERKWDNLLKKRKTNTLIIPLNIKRETNENNTKPW